MFEKIKPMQVLEAEKVLVEVFRITKLANQKAMIGITTEDLEYLALNLANEYLAHDFNEGIKLLREGVNQFFKLSESNPKIEIGDFTRICHSLKEQHAEELRSQSLLNYKPLTRKEKNKDEIPRLKEMIKSVVKPLPYNKNIRVYSHEENKTTDLKPVVNIDFEGSHWKQGCHSDGPKLYEKCVAVGHLAPVESIANPELRELYHKAWTVGLMPEEKQRFYDLLPAQPKVQVLKKKKQ